MSTSISWVRNPDGTPGETWNPIAMRCTPCSPGCNHCWHLRMATRLAANPALPAEVRTAYAGTAEPVMTDRINDPLHWKKPRTIAVQLMGDPFHESVPFEWIDRIYAVMALCPQHRFMMLTKWIERMAEYFAGHRQYSIWDLVANYVHAHIEDNVFITEWPLDNVAHGGTICNPDEARKLNLLCQIPGLLWVSYEPALGPVDFRPWLYCPDCGYSRLDVGLHGDHHLCKGRGPCLDLIVAGGETGPGARPSHPDWFRVVRDQCAEAGVGFHLKSWGEWAPFTDNGPLPKNCGYVGLDGTVRLGDWEAESDWCMGRIGHTQAGRVLDGQEHNGGIAW